MNTEFLEGLLHGTNLDLQSDLRAVVFDYGGVLTCLPTAQDWERMALLAGTELAKLSDSYWRNRYPYEVGRYDSATYWGLVARDCDVAISDDTVRELVNQDNEQWGCANPIAIMIVRQVRRSGLRTALLSNMQPDMLSFVRKKHSQWLNEFDVSVISCEVAEAKPEPAIFTLTAERLGLPPQDCLFVDDRKENVEGARIAGMRAMHIGSENALPALAELLGKLGVKLFQHRSGEENPWRAQHRS